MKKLVIIVLVMLLAVPAFALNDHSMTNQQGQIATGGRADADASARSTSSSRQMQGQGQLQGQAQGQIGEVNVSGDSEKHIMGEALYLAAPTTTAAQGQQASAVYSIFGGVNMAQTAEYQICKEKIDVATMMVKNGYLTVEEGKAEALKAYQELLDNTQAKRILWVGPKTRGVHLGNLFGMLAMDSCNEINTDNWLGTKDTITKLMKKK